MWATRIIIGSLILAVAGPAAAITLEDGICRTTNLSPESFDFTQTDRRWAAVALNPTGNDNKDLQLRIDTGQLQVTLASSAWLQGTEYIVGDFNHNYVGEYLAYVHGGNFDAPYRVQWDSGGEMEVGTPVSGTIATSGDCGLIRVWDLHLLADREYEFTLISQDNYDLRLAVFKNPSDGIYWGTRGHWELSLYAGDPPVVYPTTGEDDDYGVVVYDASRGITPGSFTLRVEDVTPCVDTQGSDCAGLIGVLPRCVELPTGTGYWTGIAVAPESGDSKDLCVYTGPNGTGEQLICSSSSGTNFVVGDFNNAPPQMTYPLISGGSRTAPYVVQWEGGPETLDIGEAWTGEISGGNSGDCNLIQVSELPLEAGTTYHFTAFCDPNVRVALFRNPGQAGYWAGRGDAEFEINSEEHDYTAPADGTYAVVVFSEDLTVPDQTFIVWVSTRVDLAEDSCAASNTIPTMYTVSQTRHHWAALAVKGELMAEVSLQLSGVPSIVPEFALVGTPLNSFAYVVGDFNHNQIGEYHGGPFGLAPSYDHTADWDSGGTLELGQPVHGSLGDMSTNCALIDMHDVALEEGACYRITLEASGSIVARAALFENPAVGAYWAADHDAVFDLSAGKTPYIFTADRTDVFGIAVYDRSYGPSSGDYTLEIVQLDPGCTSLVELSSFETESTGDAIELRWGTHLETDHLGFRLSRVMDDGESDRGRFEPIGPELIRPAGDDHDYVYTDADPALEPGVAYLYRLDAVDRQGGVQTFGPYRASLAGGPGAPVMTRLAAPQPNPFVERTQLAYTLAEPAQVELTIYDVRGRIVRVVDEGFRGTGEHRSTWDGRNAAGLRLPSGVYFARLVTGSVEHRARLLLVR